MDINPKTEAVEASTENEQDKVEKTAYEQLSTLLKQRADYLKPMIGDHGIKVVTEMDSRGQNSWPVVYEKVSKIQRADHDIQRYHESLIENFEIETIYPSTDTIGIVSQVRNDLKLTPYLTNVKRNCEADLFSLFIVKEITIIENVDGKDKKRIIGLKPIICLKPEVE